MREYAVHHLLPRVIFLACLSVPTSPGSTQPAPSDLKRSETNGDDAAALHTFRDEDPDMSLPGNETITYIIEGKKVTSHDFCAGKCNLTIAAVSGD